MSMSKVLEIIAAAGYGSLATCVDGVPRVRPMMFVVRPGGVLWCSTYRSSGKVRELEANPRVEACFVDGAGNHARIQATVALAGGTAEKAALLAANPKARNHFPDEHDPRFVVLALHPTRIEWKPRGFNEYRIVPTPVEGPAR